jgi:AmmeMemoRadiSam system protein A
MTCSLTPLDRRALLSAARQAFAAHLVDAPRPALTLDQPLCEAAAGVFVTLRRAEELRGCIGDPAGGPLVETVMHCAVAAASSDPRFDAVTLAELPSIEIEISVLGSIEVIADPLAIEIGRHGLIVERGRRRGLLLPQVAVEWGWDRDTFLAHTCLKAGLPADAWRHGAQVLRFEAEVFGEAGGNGSIGT